MSVGADASSLRGVSEHLVLPADDASVAWAFDLLEAARVREIGRASCRERVLRLV